ncbi:hypothetical protein IAQ61_000034, partial [Plenodomus lingam]
VKRLRRVICETTDLLVGPKYTEAVRVEESFLSTVGQDLCHCRWLRDGYLVTWMRRNEEIRGLLISRHTSMTAEPERPAWWAPNGDEWHFLNLWMMRLCLSNRSSSSL